MKKSRYTTILKILVVSSICFTFLNFGSSERQIKNFSLKNVDNKIISLSSFKNAKGFMVVFLSNQCPMAKMYTRKLNKINEKYKTKGVYLLAINAMDTLAYAEESFTLMQKKTKKENLNFPYLQDKLQVVAKQFKATHTPQAFLIWKNINGQYTIKYEGSIDDNAGDVNNAKPYLTEAVDALLLDKRVPNSKTESFGCKIFYRGSKKMV